MEKPEMNTTVNGKTVGAFPAATGTLALELGKKAGVFDSARLALLGGVGRMPLVVAGDEQATGTYFTIGASLTLGVGFAE